MTHPKVTVLMSVYNGRRYLADAIRSILDQTCTEFEFLIIDDGSIDPIDDIVSAFSDPRIRLLCQANTGLTRALNRGLTSACGEYVARMDADDLSDPARLGAQLGAMESDAHLDLVGCFFDVVDKDGRRLDSKKPFVDPVYRLWRLQFHNNYGHGSVMMRKSAVVEAGMYDATLRYAQDYDLWSRLSTKDNTKMIPRVLYKYRLVGNGAQTSVRNYDAQLATAIQISNRNLKLCHPDLDDTDCAEVRALYWEFQFEHVSREGLMLLPATFEGFCRRFGLMPLQKEGLARRVAADALDGIATSSRISDSERPDLRACLQAMALGQSRG